MALLVCPTTGVIVETCTDEQTARLVSAGYFEPNKTAGKRGAEMPSNGTESATRTTTAAQKRGRKPSTAKQID